MNFYVYKLIDPRSNTPFYVGKGSGNRAYYHVKNNNRKENTYKENIIKKIRESNLEPEIEIVKYFDTEEEAYDFEKYLIKFYGRKGYDNNGILSNICEDNRPPNHKNKTYIEIYGSKQKAIEQIEKRRNKQIEVGGYGPKKHTEITKKKISNSLLGNKNPMYGKTHTKETKNKISEALKGKASGQKNPNAKIYMLIAPTYEVYIVIGNLKRFCLLKNLSYGTASKLIQEKRNTTDSGSLKGWFIKKIEKEQLELFDNYILVNNKWFNDFKL